MSLNTKLKRVAARRSKGFTLIELAIIGLFLGLLAVFAISQFGSTATDNTKGSAMMEAAQKMSDNWAILAQTCGVSTQVGTALVGSGAATTTAGKNMSLLLGTAPVAAAYADCYKQAGVRPLLGASSGAAGAETINGLSPELATDATGTYMYVRYKQVPANLFTALNSKYGSGAAVAATATVAEGGNVSFAYTAEASGTRTVTFVRPL